ncbi:MAG: hypothetical protein AB7N61_08280 [Acidimicrobiia bacterium]
MGDNDTDWYPDPSGRFEERFLLRGEWSSLVRNAGEESVDHPGDLPIPAGISALVTAGAGTSEASVPGTALPPPPPPDSSYRPSSPPTSSLQAPPSPHAPPPPPPPSPATGRDPIAPALATVDPATPPAYIPPPPMVAPAGPRRRGMLGAGAVIGAIALVAGGNAVYRQLGATGASWPDNWDPKVTEFVHFVETERGLSFEHPVTIAYMSDADFDAFLDSRQQQGQVIAASSETATGPDGADAAQKTVEGKLHALGLHSGSLDLGEASSDLSSGIVGLYTNQDQTIRLRGSELTPEVKLTLVHELTHALQDQQFGLLKIWSSVKTDTASEAVTALLEGDARRVENAYYQSLSPTEQSAIDDLESQTIDEGTFDEAPMIFQVSLDAPYTFGSFLVRSLLANGGNDAVDEAFTNLPESELSLFNPIDHLKRLELGHVEAPVLPEELKQLGETETFGPLTWYLIASTRLDVSQALDLADLWRGDQSVTYSRPDGVVCVRSAITTASIDDTAKLQTLLSAWAAAVPAPAEPPTVASNKVSVVVDTCDQSGAMAPDLETRLSDAYALAATRASVWAATLESDPDIDLPTVECYGNYVVRAFTPQELLGAADPTPEQQAILEAGRQACIADPTTIAPPPTTTIPVAAPDAGGSVAPTGPSL